MKKNHKLIVRCIIAIAVIMVAYALPSQAATTWYVSTDGNDSDLGTSWGTAFATISNAVAQATTPGDTVLVTNGTYNIFAAIEITNGITLKSVNGAKLTIVDAGNRAQVGCFRILHEDAILEGFTAKRGKMTSVAKTSGGIHMSAGTVRWCRIIDNYGYSTGEYVGGGSVNMSGGLMHHCIIQDGQQNIYNGTIYLTGNAILRNCLVTDNKYRRGGGIYINGSSSRVENCTVVKNNGSEHTGGIYRGGGTIVNTIVYFNTDPTVDYNNVRGGSAGFTYCCSTPLLPGTGNIDDAPLLVDIDNRDYHLLPGSPVIGAGTTNLAWLAATPDEVDLDGNPRVVNGSIDMGAYQYTPGALDCGFSADTLAGLAPLEVQFTSVVSGTNTTDLSYFWDLNGNDEIDSTTANPTTSYVPGTYSVSLTVSNAVGEGVTYTRPDYIQSAPLVCFVATNSTPAFPFDTWGTASSSLQAAIDAALDGTLIRVGDGVYPQNKRTDVLKGVTIRSENGRDHTVVTHSGSGDMRALYLSHPDAIVDGLTIKRKGTGSSNGVQIHNFGTIRNCAILDGNSANGYGANASLNGGMISNCLISGGTDRHIGGVKLTNGALMENCVVVGNKSTINTGTAAVGGVSVDSGSKMRNCLLMNNSGGGYSGGALLINGTIENCTIVNNTVNNTNTTAAGGLRLAGGTVRNTIVAYNGNPAGNAHTNWYRSSNGTIEYTCTIPDASAYGLGNITDDPSFVGEDDYKLNLGSPCINAGDFQSWMTDATDLNGNPRIKGLTVDMGAYEYQPLQGTLIIIQ